MVLFSTPEFPLVTPGGWNPGYGHPTVNSFSLLGTGIHPPLPLACLLVTTDGLSIGAPFSHGGYAGDSGIVKGQKGKGWLRLGGRRVG